MLHSPQQEINGALPRFGACRLRLVGLQIRIQRSAHLQRRGKPLLRVAGNRLVQNVEQAFVQFRPGVFLHANIVVDDIADHFKRALSLRALPSRQ